MVTRRILGNRNSSRLPLLIVIALAACANTLSVGGGVAAEPSSTSSSANVEFLWSGGVTTNSARVIGRVSVEGAVVRLAVSAATDFSHKRFGAADTAAFAHNDRVVSLTIDSLDPDTRYWYALEINGELSLGKTGQFRTFPAGEASFTFAFASCSSTGSNHDVFNVIQEKSPLFFLHLGDMHYENISANDRGLYRDAFRSVLSSPSQSRLYRTTPIVYTWDDHDYGPNGADSTSPGREAAQLTYREYVPSYPLVEGGGAAAIYQSFTVGRVRLVMCDSRSARSPAQAPDDSSKTMLGEAQKTWFESQLIEAHEAGQVVVWVNSVPWIGESGDSWHCFTNERRELADFIKDNHIERLCMISGDAHMLAIDDGTNSDYSESGGAGFPVIHAAPLDRRPSVKGGPYSHGQFPGPAGQFGTMTVTDTSDSLRITWKAWRMDKILAGYTFSFDMR